MKHSVGFNENAKNNQGNPNKYIQSITIMQTIQGSVSQGENTTPLFVTVMFPH